MDDDPGQSAVAQQFFDRLSCHYAQLSHTPVSVVRAAAYCYASHRGFLRLASDPRGPDRGFLSALGLLQRSQEALEHDDPPVGVLTLLRTLSADVDQAQARASVAEAAAHRWRRRLGRRKRRQRQTARSAVVSSASGPALPWAGGIGGLARRLSRWRSPAPKPEEPDSGKPNEPGSLG
jgi:hypothetical protein